jgi:hypothetical protein
MTFINNLQKYPLPQFLLKTLFLPIEKLQTINMLAKKSLEKQNQDWVCDFNFTEEKNLWDDCINPNESNPINIKPLLEEMQPGFLVSAGYQRSLFDLILSPKDKCKGLINIDCNPNIKAVFDFTILLLRLFDRKKFTFYTTHSVRSQGFAATLSEIEKALIASDIPPFMKKYYQKNLNAFAKKFYTKVRTYWRKEAADFFEGVLYYKDDNCYAKLQEYAKKGNIIAICKSIQDDSLKRFKKEVSFIDESNIPNYLGNQIHWCRDSTRIVNTLLLSCSDESLEKLKKRGLDVQKKKIMFCDTVYFSFPYANYNSSELFEIMKALWKKNGKNKNYYSVDKETLSEAVLQEEKARELQSKLLLEKIQKTFNLT